MKPEILTLNGKSFAILPLKEYEALSASAEELEDILLYDAAVARDEERFPSTIADRMIAGENTIKIFREYRKFTQQKLADEVGITRTYLAALESGSKQGSIKVLKALAQTLRIDLDLVC